MPKKKAEYKKVTFPEVPEDEIFEEEEIQEEIMQQKPPKPYLSVVERKRQLRKEMEEIERQEKEEETQQTQQQVLIPYAVSTSEMFNVINRKLDIILEKLGV